ncbi:MAG: chemotaxis protein CheW [bacterium]|nr:chemotaxis protein CheW [bacterium]MDT8366051.1 chemotaxis protein CheW [bacterium]
MADRAVIVRAGAHLVSLPFGHIDEILGADRIQSVQDLPEGVIPEGSPEGLHPQHWVHSRGAWLPVDILLPGSGLFDSSQVVVVRWGDEGRAFAVDHVLGIEASSEMAAFPLRALPYTDVPIAGVRFRKDGLVLELDLSRLISLDLGS